MILFSNPGIIDLNAALLMGVNAKTSDNPIGFFGSGLKYAIAVLLRTGHKVVLCTGIEPHLFTAEQIETRGKIFHRVCMDGQSLGFTTELGKTWQVWEAFRELYCNAKDEKGNTDYLCAGDLESVALLPNYTSIIVIGPEIDAAWHARGEFLYLHEPDITLPGLAEITKRPAEATFYRGIRVAKNGHGWPMMVNFLCPMTLTENRTLAYDWQLNEKLAEIGDELAKLNEIDMVKSLLLPKNSSAPTNNILWGGYFDNEKRSDEWLQIARGVAKNDFMSLSAAARSVYGRMSPKQDLEIEKRTLTPIQDAMFARALKVVETMGIEPKKYPIIFVDRIGDQILGLAQNGKIFISSQAFDQGTKRLAGTILEEYIHLHYRHTDQSRGMQDFLIDRMMSMSEEIMGEPI